MQLIIILAGTIVAAIPIALLLDACGERPFYEVS